MPTIGYVLCSEPELNLGSTRISATSMFPYLRDAGYNPVVIFQPVRYYDQDREANRKLEGIVQIAEREKCDVVYFQKVSGLSAIKVARALKEYGAITIFGVCDLVDNGMADTCDATVASSDYVRRHYNPDLQAKIVVIYDGIEKPEIRKIDYSTHFATKANPIKAVLLTSLTLEQVPFLTHLPEYVKLSVIGKYDSSTYSIAKAKRGFNGIISDPSFENVLYYLLRLSRHISEKSKGYVNSCVGIPFERIPWNIDDAIQVLTQFDIGIIPVELETDSGFSRKNSKSANRLTQLMSVGLPVIASPVDSYLPVIQNGENGLIAKTMSEWTEAFEILRNPKTRVSIGKKARASIIHEFSQRQQAEKLIDLLNSLTKN